MLNERSIRKCGENPRLTDQTPVLSSGDLRFCCRRSGCARRVPNFPALPKNAIKSAALKRKCDKYPLENSPQTRRPPSRGSIKIGDALLREGTPLQNFGLNKQASVFHCLTIIAQAIISNCHKFAATNSPLINRRGKPRIDYLCKKFKSRQHLKISTIVINMLVHSLNKKRQAICTMFGNAP